MEVTTSSAASSRSAGVWTLVSAFYWEIRCYLTRFRVDHIRARWHADEDDWWLTHLIGGPVPTPENKYVDIAAELVADALAEAVWN